MILDRAVIFLAAQSQEMEADKQTGRIIIDSKRAIFHPRSVCPKKSTATLLFSEAKDFLKSMSFTLAHISTHMYTKYHHTGSQWESESKYHCI